MTKPPGGVEALTCASAALSVPAPPVAPAGVVPVSLATVTLITVCACAPVASARLAPTRAVPASNAARARIARPAHRCRAAPRNAIARVRCQSMISSPPRERSVLRCRAIPFAVMQRDVCIDSYGIITGATGADQFRAVGRDGDCRVLRLPRHTGNIRRYLCAYKTNFLLDYNSKRC